MTEEEKVTTEMWSMDELVALTDEVQEEEVEFRGKAVKFQFCELTEKEEPKFTGISDNMAEDKKMQMYQDLGSKRVLKMLLKANKKNPEGPVVTQEQWAMLPTTLRFKISNTVIGAEAEVSESFQD